MFKDLILAIILGALLGFGGTGGYFALTKNKPSAPLASESVSPTPAPDAFEFQTASQSASPTPDAALSEASTLVIDTPKDQSIVSNSKITLKGSTSPNSIVIVKTPVKSYTLTSNEKGAFSAEIEIESGANFVLVSAIDPNDVQTDAKILVTYSTTQI